MTHPTIGIIGGSGLYDMAELTDREERTLATPFGDPSGPYVIGTLRGQRVAFLAPHSEQRFASCGDQIRIGQCVEF